MNCMLKGRAKDLTGVIKWAHVNVTPYLRFYTTFTIEISLQFLQYSARSHFLHPSQRLKVTSQSVPLGPSPLGSQNGRNKLWRKSKSRKRLSILTTPFWSSTSPGPEVPSSLLSTTYHLSFNHVQDDWEVGVDHLLA